MSPSEYEGLHRRARLLYGGQLLLAGEKNEKPTWHERISRSFNQMLRALYTQREVTPELLTSGKVKHHIRTTASILNEAVDMGIGRAAVSDIMRDRLHHANLVFSGFKVFHQMKEAFPSLLDENGNRKPFERFSNEVQKVHEQYNVQYLQAEYNFAVGSAQMAAKWEEYAQAGDRYDLQYRTAGDKRVRESHSKLHGVTLPVQSRFWEEYFPPNGWGCRCTVVQVRKGKYPTSDEATALKDGNQSTTGRHAEMFRFNPGKQRAAFPAYNPYTISACTDCTKSGFKLAAKLPDNELCRACEYTRKLKEREIQDVQTVAELVDAFDGSWHSRGRAVYVCEVDEIVMKFLQTKIKEYQIREIYLLEDNLIHAVRDAKTSRNAHLPLEEIRRLPEILQQCKDVYWDNTHNNLQYIYIYEEEYYKIVVDLEYKRKIKRKKKVFNAIITAGRIKEEDTQQKNLEKIK